MFHFRLLLLIFLIGAHVSMEAQPYKVQVGDWSVWSLDDGYLDLDQLMFVDVSAEVLRQKLADAGVECVSDLVVRTPVYGFLIETQEALILVDTGCGVFGGDNAGYLAYQIYATGHHPDEVTHILLTHLHPDHVGGLLTRCGLPSFPKATVWVSAIEAAYWRDPAEEAVANEDFKPCFAIARLMLAPYEQEGRLQVFQDQDTLLPGVTALMAPGHTPGHSAFLLCSNKEKMLLWGDIVHSYGVQFTHPEWHVIYDSDGALAVESRAQLFALAAEEPLIVGGAHLPEPGFGHVMHTEGQYHWEPLSP